MQADLTNIKEILKYCISAIEDKPKARQTDKRRAEAASLTAFAASLRKWPELQTRYQQKLFYKGLLIN